MQEDSALPLPAGGDEAGNGSVDESGIVEAGSGDIVARNPTPRWSKDETMALLNIRFRMCENFKQTAIKDRLWEDVSRELARLGYNRSDKKCKEKVQNVFKYYKGVQEGRTSSRSRKYKFADQIKSIIQLDATLPIHASSDNSLPVNAPQVTMDANKENFVKGSKVKKRRSTKNFYVKLMNTVMESQETFQKNMIEAFERIAERRQLARVEARWTEEIDRIKGEYKVWARERAVATRKYEAILEFFNKYVEHVQKPTV